MLAANCASWAGPNVPDGRARPFPLPALNDEPANPTKAAKNLYQCRPSGGEGIAPRRVERPKGAGSRDGRPVHHPADQETLAILGGMRHDQASRIPTGRRPAFLNCPAATTGLAALAVAGRAAGSTAAVAVPAALAQLTGDPQLHPVPVEGQHSPGQDRLDRVRWPHHRHAVERHRLHHGDPPAGGAAAAGPAGAGERADHRRAARPFVRLSAAVLAGARTRDVSRSATRCMA
jgi:hypothetical protein